ncbi:MAG: DUF1684 domain-containing protein [Anaerolineae bacterium]|nr:DUF1684 domain-containing protein [Anaerolineae bacterium]
MTTDAHQQYRQEANEFFKTHPQSPLTPEQREQFTSMDWFPYNPDLILTLEAEEFEEKPEITLPRSSDNKPPGVYQQWGRLRFTVEGQEITLLLLYSPEHKYFFLGFWDTTSGTETYGGGRYLDSQRLPDGRFAIDFNRAYNPYCAYNDQFACIIPPAENRLPVRIAAGQKAFKK